MSCTTVDANFHRLRACQRFILGTWCGARWTWTREPFALGDSSAKLSRLQAHLLPLRTIRAFCGGGAAAAPRPIYTFSARFASRPYLARHVNGKAGFDFTGRSLLRVSSLASYGELYGFVYQLSSRLYSQDRVVKPLALTDRGILQCER